MKPQLSASRAAGWTREELEAELGRVHEREFARLLCRAARLCLARRLEIGAWLRELGLEDGLERWRGDARRARRLAEVDGYELPGLLRHALSRELADWAGEAEYVRAALALDPSEGPRFHAAAFAFLAGAPEARARLSEFARGATRADWRRRARATLAWPARLAGEERRPW